MPAKNSRKKYAILIGVLFLFPIAFMLVLGPGAKHHFETLPYFGPFEIVGNDTMHHQLPALVLMDEEGAPFPLDSLHGKFYLAALFSVNDTNLSKITKRMLYFLDRYIDEPDITIVCFDTEPTGQPKKELKEFIDRMPTYDNIHKKMRFLTGTPEGMDSLFRTGFLIHDISHEEIFRLVDNEGHLRAKYGNTEYHIGDAISDAGMLKKEYDRKEADARKRR